ncbi:MAG: helix-turn-helix transcriptional regulator [Defluviitaleaceae bacterium]|nr:helix-turn-helix transcriptional regulator [Defluviitaleaceae bacterium]
MEHIKNELIDQFFKLDGKSRKSELKKIQKELLAFQKKYNYDFQVDGAMLVSKMYLAKMEGVSYSEISEIIYPVGKRLENIMIWELTDIRLLALTVSYNRDYLKIPDLIDKAVVELERYKDSELYEDVKISLYFNTIFRFLKVRFEEIDYTAEDNNFNILEQRFLEYFEKGIKLCEESKNHTHNFITKKSFIARKAAFKKETELIQETLEDIKKVDRIVWKKLNDEINTYSKGMGSFIAKSQFNSMIGKHLKELRLENNMSHEDIGALINMKHTNIGAYERGEQSVAAITVYKLSTILDVEIGRLYFGKEGEFKKVDERTAIINKIIPALSTLPKEKLELIKDLAIDHSNV